MKKLLQPIVVSFYSALPVRTSGYLFNLLFITKSSPFGSDRSVYCFGRRSFHNFCSLIRFTLQR